MLINLMRKLVNAHKKRTASPLPDPKWLEVRQSRLEAVRLPFVHSDHRGVEDAWEDVLDATFDGMRADRIGDCIYLTGSPSGFDGRAQ